MRAALVAWSLLFALLLPAAAFADDDTDEPDDPQDTGDELEDDEDDPVDPDPFRGGSTASDLAGEEGGMDCSAAGGSAALLVLLPLASLGRRRR